MDSETGGTPRTTIRVVGAVFIDGQRVLAFKRAAHKVDPGVWEFPGGKVEPGETEQDALRREILEELGIEVSVGDHVHTSLTHIEGRRRIKLVCFAVEGDTEEISIGHSHDESRWVPINDARILKWAAPDVPILDKLLQRLGGGTDEVQHR